MRSYTVTAATLVLALWTSCSLAAEIRLISVLPAKEMLADLAPQFEHQTGNKVVVTWTGSVDLKKRILAGESYDLILTTDKDINDFAEKGVVLGGSKVDLMRSSIGFAVREGATKPVIQTPDDLKNLMLSAKAVGYSTGSSGVHLENIFKQMGIWDQIKPKLIKVPSGQTVGQVLAAGDADVGFQQVSELIHHPGISYVGPLPQSLQQVTIYSVAISKNSNATEAARALGTVLSSKEAAKAKTEHGMEPIDR
ncbi:substrate-binding domain-containing protein [Alsobacter sp. SYSU BS001988]